MLLLRGEAPFAQRGWKDALNVSLQEASALKRRFLFFSPMPTYPVAACCLIYARLLDLIQIQFTASKEGEGHR